MKRVIAYILAILLLAVVAFIISRLPLPNSKSRDTIGTKFTYTVEHNYSPELKADFNYYVSGEGPPVALIPSAGRPASDFNELVTALNEAGYKTFAFDHAISPGESGVVAVPSGIELAVPPILQAIEPQDNQRIFVIGHAFGNRLSRAFATLHPSKTEAVILLAAGGQNTIEPKAEAALKNAFDPRISAGQRRKDIAYGFFADGNEVPKYWMRGWDAEIATRQGKMKNMPIGENTGWEAAGGVPMLVVQAAEDRIAPKADTADMLAARYPRQVQVVMIENAGHALLPEQPDAVAKAVIDYIKLTPLINRARTTVPQD